VATSPKLLLQATRQLLQVVLHALQRSAQPVDRPCPPGRLLLLLLLHVVVAARKHCRQPLLLVVLLALVLRRRHWGTVGAAVHCHRRWPLLLAGVRGGGALSRSTTGRRPL
jgi:hypothetical protein